MSRIRTLCGTILAATVVAAATGLADVSKVDSRYFADESGEMIPFVGGFKCYLPWENRWMNVERGSALPDFKRSMVVSIYDSNDAKPNSGKK